MNTEHHLPEVRTGDNKKVWGHHSAVTGSEHRSVNSDPCAVLPGGVEGIREKSCTDHSAPGTTWTTCVARPRGNETAAAGKQLPTATSPTPMFMYPPSQHEEWQMKNNDTGYYYYYHQIWHMDANCTDCYTRKNQLFSMLWLSYHTSSYTQRMNIKLQQLGKITPVVSPFGIPVPLVIC